MKKSKFVDSWFVNKLPNGIYNLVINTTEKCCYHHYYGNNEEFMEFIVRSYDIDIIDDEENILEIPIFLPKIDNGLWLESSNTVKDQIHCYFIPYHFEWVKEKKVEMILNSEEHE